MCGDFHLILPARRSRPGVEWTASGGLGSAYSDDRLFYIHGGIIITLEISP